MMGKALWMCGLAILASSAAACGEEIHKGPIFPPHMVLASYPAEEAVANPTERQPGPGDSPESPEATPTQMALAAKPDTQTAAAATSGAGPAPATEPEVRAKAAPLPVPADVAELVAAIDRYDSDRDLDAGRHPGELLAFLELSRGMKVAELVAGRGYTTELLARRVGPSGKVWAENPASLAGLVGRALNERLGKTVMQNTVAIERPADAPFPAEARDLDAVVCVLAYHDIVGLKVDRDKMNKAVFDALKPGGEYVVVDHSASPGRGTKDAQTLHRIEESAVVAEVLRAGFQQGPSAAFLRNPEDARDWNASPNAAGDKRGTSDRFVLKFVRP